MTQHISAKKHQETPHTINSTQNTPGSNNNVPDSTNVTRSTKKATKARNRTSPSENAIGPAKILTSSLTSAANSTKKKTRAATVKNTNSTARNTNGAANYANSVAEKTDDAAIYTNSTAKKTNGAANNTNGRTGNIYGTARDTKAPAKTINGSAKNTISAALKRRAQYLLKDISVDASSRALIRYALEISDPWLAELVRRADAGEPIVDAIDFSQTPAPSEDNHDQEKIAALTEMICRAGDEPETKSTALLVLMATLENAAHPKALANTAKHLAFTRCGELNLCGMVDAQIAALEAELLAGCMH